MSEFWPAEFTFVTDTLMEDDFEFTSVVYFSYQALSEGLGL